MPIRASGPCGVLARLLTALLIVSIACAAMGQAVPASKPATAPASRPAATASSRPQAESARRLQRLARLNREIIAQFKKSDFAGARDSLEKLLQADPDYEIGWYNLACAYGRLNEPAKAVDCLEKAVAKGYCDFQHMERDEDLACLRSVKEYKQLLSRREQIQHDRAARICDDLRARYGDDYICEVDTVNKLVFATNVDRDTLENLKTRLTGQAKALWTDMFSHKLEQYVTVIITKTDSSKMGSIGGYYVHDMRLLTAKTVGMTVVHEFTHALHAGDQDGMGQQHPIWIVEGLATMVESSEITGGHVKPMVNHRLNALKELVEAGQTIPWRSFFKMSHADFMKKAYIAYPQCRYIMMYLHERGKLKAWYDAYTAGYEADPTGVAAMEKVLGKKLDDAEADWLKWVERAKAAPVALPPNHAYLGVRVEPETDGVQVTQVVGGSAADNAGIRAGDVIFKIDSRDVIDPGDLILLVDGKKVGDKLKVQFKRAGEARSVVAVLGAMPASVSTTRPQPPRIIKPPSASGPKAPSTQGSARKGRSGSPARKAA